MNSRALSSKDAINKILKGDYVFEFPPNGISTSPDGPPPFETIRLKSMVEFLLDKIIKEENKNEALELQLTQLKRQSRINYELCSI